MQSARKLLPSCMMAHTGMLTGLWGKTCQGNPSWPSSLTRRTCRRNIDHIPVLRSVCAAGAAVQGYYHLTQLCRQAAALPVPGLSCRRSQPDCSVWRYAECTSTTLLLWQLVQRRLPHNRAAERPRQRLLSDRRRFGAQTAQPQLCGLRHLHLESSTGRLATATVLACSETAYAALWKCRRRSQHCLDANEPHLSG